MQQIVVAKPDPAPFDAHILRELSDSDADVSTLRLVYDSFIRVKELADLRLPNMETYLRARNSEGCHNKNKYHIVVAQIGRRVTASSVARYVANANVGIIEFFEVVPERAAAASAAGC